MKLNYSCGVIIVCLISLVNPASAEVGITASEILIGTTRNLSGTDTRPKEIAEGQKLYLDAVNKAGGVFGRKIILKEYDDAYDQKRTYENVKTLIEQDKVFAIFGTYGTGNLKAASPLIAKAGIPAFAVSASLGWIPENAVKTIYAVKATYSDESRAMATFASKTKNWKRIGLFYQDDALGEEGRSGLLRSLREQNLHEALLKSFARDGTNIDGSFVTELQASKPDALVIFGNAPAAIKLCNELAKVDLKFPILASSALVASNFIEAVQKNGQEVFFFQSYPLATDTSESVVAAFHKDATKAGTKTGDSQLLGYIDGMVLTEALKLTGQDLTRAKFLETVNTKMKNYDVKGLEINFGPDHHSGLTKIHISTLKNAKLAPL